MKCRLINSAASKIESSTFEMIINVLSTELYSNWLILLCYRICFCNISCLLNYTQIG